jgi:hypothetical protein
MKKGQQEWGKIMEQINKRNGKEHGRKEEGT